MAAKMSDTCSFRDFRKLCHAVANESKYLEKTKAIEEFIRRYDTDTQYLIVKMLLPSLCNRVYRLNDVQLVKLFSKLFKKDVKSMLTDLEKGYVAVTIKEFFESSESFIKPIKKSILTLNDVDSFLAHLTTLTKEKDQAHFLGRIASVSTGNDLKCFILFIKNDLQIKAGTKCVLNALGAEAYTLFKTSQDLKKIVYHVLNESSDDVSTGPGTPVKPMLADICRSVSVAVNKYKRGIYAEIKYDGERVQIHKYDNIYEFYSRNLKRVTPHKVQGLDDALSIAFPSANNFILDAELVLVDERTGECLPFGSLGVHKKASFESSTPCLFVFDCLYYNDKSLLRVPFVQRRAFIEAMIKEIKHKITMSDIRIIRNESDITEALQESVEKGLEGLMLKGGDDVYKPGLRGWLKIKKDHLKTATSMTDSADLVVLGAYYGKGCKGGIMSVFLMGCYDEEKDNWKTVTKCSGHTDKTLQELQSMDVIKIGKDPAKIPDWLIVHKTYYPDFVVRDPTKAPVWEISGASFSSSPNHTANGISIRFPRCTKIRDDKSWRDATTLRELTTLYAS
ncbi:m133R [Myxoma virus]|uniref:DNA ligase n=1 Tax=Myxoma virus TaxID=10273 RepID=A0A481NDN8_9POXV|nr:m133R [Myxoma virus]